MKKFTFIAEFRGGTYINQYEALDLKDALFIWADNLDPQILTNKIKAKMREKTQNEDFFPVPIRTINNVWCSSSVVFRSLLHLNIVETV